MEVQDREHIGGVFGLFINTVVTKDMIERYDVRNEALFIALIELLCSSIGSYVSTNMIANALKTNGFKSVDNETVSRYLSHVCDAFLFVFGASLILCTFAPLALRRRGRSSG